MHLLQLACPNINLTDEFTLLSFFIFTIRTKQFTFAKSSAFPRVPPSSSGKMLGSKFLCKALKSEPWKWIYNVENTLKA